MVYIFMHPWPEGKESVAVSACIGDIGQAIGDR